MVWSYINPLTQFLMYIFIFTLLMGRGQQIEHFAIHVFASIMVVGLFTETVAAGTRSIVRNASLLQKSAMPRETFPLASTAGLRLPPVAGVRDPRRRAVLHRLGPHAGRLRGRLLGYALIMIFALALSLMLSVSQVFLRDTGQIVAVLNNFVRFGVPMMYPYTIVAIRFHGHTELYLSNPIAIAVLLVQRCFWVPTTTDPELTIAWPCPTISSSAA